MDESRISRIAQLAEIIASIGVIATLLFLALEVQQNSSLVRTSMYETTMQAINEWRMQIANDQDSRELYFRYEKQGVSEFSDQELDHLLLIQNTVWSIYERAYFAYQRDLLGPQEWGRFERNICDQYSRATQFWAKKIQNYLTGEFGSYVLRNCASDA